MTKADVFAVLAFNLALGAAAALPVEMKSIYFGSEVLASCSLKDKGFAVVSSSYRSIYQGIDIQAFDSSGNLRWRNFILRAYYLFGYKILQTKDGGLAILGTKLDGISNRNSIFFKTDSIGQVVSEKPLGAEPLFFDFLVETPDSGFLAAVYGDRFNRIGFQTIYKLDKMGIPVSTMDFRGQPDFRVTAVGIASGTDIILAGFRKHPDGRKEIFLRKEDSSGGLIWERILFTGSEGTVESIEPVEGGGFLLAGFLAREDDWGSEAVLLKTNAEGFPIRSRTYGFPQERYAAYSAKSMDGGWVAAGRGTSGARASAFRVVSKIDSLGRVIWKREFTDYRTSEDPAFSVIAQGPGKFVVCPQRCTLFEDPDYLAP